jgi:hypothetical protein
MRKTRFPEVILSRSDGGWDVECPKLGLFGRGYTIGKAVGSLCSYLLLDCLAYVLTPDAQLDAGGLEMKQKYMALAGKGECKDAE